MKKKKIKKIVQLHELTKNEIIRLLSLDFGLNLPMIYVWEGQSQ